MRSDSSASERIDNATKLELWRLDRCLSYRELAMKWGMDYTTIYRWCWSQRFPSKKNAVIIEAKTKIPMAYWVKLKKTRTRNK